MKDYIGAAVAALALHGALAFAIDPYRRLVTDAGGLLVHGNDIADLPRMALAGVAAVGTVWILLAIGLVALVRRV